MLSMVGRGGMGALYQARQIALDRFVAIKLLPTEFSVDAAFADRFRREARALAKRNHPNIVAVHDSGSTADGHVFIVMEFVARGFFSGCARHRAAGRYHRCGR